MTPDPIPSPDSSLNGARDARHDRTYHGEIDEAAFAAPVQRHRRAGWTAARMVRFVLRLAETRNVQQCCDEAGLSRQSAYALRRRNEAFRLAWDEALKRHDRAIVETLLDSGCIERAMREMPGGERRECVKRLYDSVNLSPRTAVEAAGGRQADV